MAAEPTAKLPGLSPMRQAIARQVTRSWTTVPHFYVAIDVDMEPCAAAVKSLNATLAEAQPDAKRASMSAALIHAITLVLRELPEFNATWTADGLVQHESVNVGVAVAVPGGLIAPAILGCEARDTVEIAEALGDLAERARVGRARGREMTEATFTLSNLGGSDVSSFAAIVNPPQVAILATGRASRRPWVVGDEIVIRRVMTATLSVDHRALDGTDAARFLGRLKQLLEAPEEWLEGARTGGDA